MKFSMKDFFSKFDQARSFLWIWSHLLKKSIMENFIFCAFCYFMRLHDFTLKAMEMKEDFSLDFGQKN